VPLLRNLGTLTSWNLLGHSRPVTGLLYVPFRRDRCSRGGGVLICVKNYIDCRVLWTDEVFEMIAVEVKGKNPKCAWELVGVYIAPNEDMRAIERFAARTGFTGNSTKRSIIGGDLNLPYAE
jgi:hypothetical protein